MASVVKLYTREYCGYCDAARSLLEGKQLGFEEIDCSGDDQKRAWLRAATGQSTVPQIFIHERSVGGFTELRALAKSGQLEQLIANPPAPDDVDDDDEEDPDEA
ncbi:MAG: glutaredoxin domain-containing protein [Kofleriaceae bacterium]